MPCRLLLALLALQGQPPAADPKAEFTARFQAAAALKDSAEMDRLLQRFKEPAIEVFLNRADQRSAAPTAQLNEWVDAFVAAWDRVFKTGFARNYDRYLQMLDNTRRAARSRLLIQVLPGLNAAHIKAAKSQEAADWSGVQLEVDAFIPSIEATGDLFYIAFAYNIQGNSWNEACNPRGGNNQKALEAYEKCLQARERLGLTQDVFFTQVRTVTSEVCAALGIPDPNAPPGTKPAVAAERILAAEGAEWATFALEPGAEEKPGGLLHPSDLADSHRYSWLQFTIEPPGEEAALPLLDPPVKLVRRSFNEFVLDAGAGPSKPFRLGAEGTLVRYERRHQDGSASEHALLIACGSERDQFHGADLNYALTDGRSTGFVRSVAMRTAETPYGDLALFDLNCDGRFGHAEPTQVGEHGLPRDTFLLRYDGILLGKGNRTAPFSPWFPGAGGQWFEVQMDDHGRGAALRLRLAAPKLGTVKVVFGGVSEVKLASLVFKSETPATKGLIVDMAGGKGGVVQLPIGRYSLQQGLLRGDDGAEAIILPPVDVPLLVYVEEANPATLKLGAPLKLAAKMRVEGRTLTVEGRSLHVVGAAGERYVRIVGAPLFNVEAFVKGGKSGRLAAPTTENVNADWNAAFHPQDAYIQLREGETAPEVRLLLKKHRWFGSLDSDWFGTGG